MTDEKENPQEEDSQEKRLDPIAETLLAVLTKTKGPVDPTAVAQAFAEKRRKPGDRPDAWRNYLMAVKQQGLFLARRGDIEILRKGEVADPKKPIKGLIKYRLSQ